MKYDSYFKKKNLIEHKCLKQKFKKHSDPYMSGLLSKSISKILLTAIDDMNKNLKIYLQETKGEGLYNAL